MSSTQSPPSAAARSDDQPDGVIHTEDLTKVYQGTDFAAVDKLNLDIQAGEIFGLLGPNGAGKTTTAGMLTTRVVPTSGRAFIAGIDVAAHPALAKQLSGIVSQQNTLDRQLTVWENLYFHGRLFGMGARTSKQTATDLLEQLQTVELGALQPDVEEHQARPAIADLRQRGIAVARRSRGKPLVVKNPGDKVTNVGFVIDNQNITCHRIRPYSYSPVAASILAFH